MKRFRILAIVSASAFMIAFNGCNKQTDGLSKETTNSHGSYRDEEYMVSDFVGDSTDSDNARMHRTLHRICLAMLDTLVGGELLSEIYDDVEVDSYHLVFLYEFLDGHAALKAKFRDNYKAIVGAQGLNFDYEAHIQDSLVYDVEYVPIVQLYNWETCNLEEDPIIAIAVEVNEEIHESDDDAIMAWFYDPEGESPYPGLVNFEIDNGFVLWSLSEEYANNSERPIIIIANGVDRGGPVGGGGEIVYLDHGDPSCCGGPSDPGSGTDYHMRQINLAYAFESWNNKVEFGIGHADVSTDPYTYVNLHKFKIDRDDVGETLTLWQLMYSWTSELDNDNVDLFAWERDWYASSKRISSAYDDDNDLRIFESKRQYLGDWYFWNYLSDPAGYDFEGLHPSNLDDYTENGNGHIIVRRID